MQNREFYDGDLVPGTRYRVLNLLGAGGMGTVYEVEHVELGKRFVLKALIRDLARRPALVERLRNEWRALGRLEHPNIVSVTDAGMTSSGVPYYVMERLEGETLAACLRRVRRLPVPRALELCACIVEGLGAAHAIGIVHRDVKPPNVFLLNGERPKLLDFGVAKVQDVANVVTGRGVAVGTPRFMSPEQARGERVDGRSDLYACGLLLFEMIAGVGPFDDARDAASLLLAHAEREPPRLGSLVMGVLPEVDELVAGLLSKDPRRRPDNARQLASTMRALAADYARRVSVTSPTPFANYSEVTPLALDPETRDATTRPDAVLPLRETATLPVDSLTQTSADVNETRIRVAPSAPRPGDAFPTTTLAEPLSNQITEALPEGASVVTARLEPAASSPTSALVDTHTRAPLLSTPSSLKPVVPPSTRGPRPATAGAFKLAVAALALIVGGTIAWRALTRTSRALAVMPDPVTPAAASPAPSFVHPANDSVEVPVELKPVASVAATQPGPEPAAQDIEQQARPKSRPSGTARARSTARAGARSSEPSGRALPASGL